MPKPKSQRISTKLKNMKLQRKVARAIRERIDTRGWSQATATDRLSCTRAQLYDVTSGQLRHVSLDRLLRYAKGCGLRVGLTLNGVAL